MKKILLTLLAVTLTFSSCKNYDDEFAAASASIAELQAQVSGFSALQASLTALQTSLASLQSTVNSLPTSQVDLSGLEADLTTSLANVAALQTALNGIIANYATSANLAETQAAVDALNDALATAQANIDELLAGNNVYDGDLTITNAAELTFAKALANKVTIINGNVTVDIVTNSLDAAEVSSVTSKIMSVTGNTDIATDASLDFSSLALVGGFYYVTGGVMMYDKKLASTETSAINYYYYYYSIIGADINDDALTYVGGDVFLNYDGGYNQPNLKAASLIYLTDYSNGTIGKASLGAKMNEIPTNYIGTLTVDFSGLTDCSAINTTNYYNKGANTANKTSSPSSGNVYFGAATSVKLNAGVTYVYAPEALTVDLLAANYTNGLVINAQADGSVITIAGRVDDGDSTSPTGQYLEVSGSATSVLNAANVSRVSGIDVYTIETALSFPALTKATDFVYADKTVSFSAPLLVANYVSAYDAKTVHIGSANLDAGVVETLTFTALASSYTAATTLKTANITGKVGAAGAFTSTSANLTSAVFAGELDAVTISGAVKLTTLTTTGAIDMFFLNDSDIITSISLGHSHITGGEGSVVSITNNAKLASLTTSTNYLNALTVKDNDALATMNFASYVNVPAIGTYNIIISGNKLSGTFTPAVAATGTTPYVEAVITSASLATLKPWINAFKTAKSDSGVYVEGAPLALAVDIDDVDPAVDETLKLGTAMSSNHTVSTAIDNNYGINLVAEFLLIQ